MDKTAQNVRKHVRCNRRLLIVIKVNSFIRQSMNLFTIRKAIENHSSINLFFSFKRLVTQSFKRLRSTSLCGEKRKQCSAVIILFQYILWRARNICMVVNTAAKFNYYTISRIISNRVRPYTHRQTTLLFVLLVNYIRSNWWN